MQLTRYSSQRALNVQSPAFTPTLAHAKPVKQMGISPKAVAAAAFTPRGSGKRSSRPGHHRRGSSLTGSVTPAAPLHSKQLSEEFIPQQPFQQIQQISEFVPGPDFVPGQDFLSGQQFMGVPSVSCNTRWRRNSTVLTRYSSILKHTRRRSTTHMAILHSKA